MFKKILFAILFNLVFLIGCASSKNIQKNTDNTQYIEYAKLAWLAYPKPVDNDEFYQACYMKAVHLINEKWELLNIPLPPEKAERVKKLNLKYFVYKNKQTHTLAIVFEGTELFSISDWRSNFHWLLKFLPNHKDEYSAVREIVAKSVWAWVKENNKEDISQLKMITVGHSLGGGLAQDFALAFPSDDPAIKITETWVFNTSPITGSGEIAKETRERNAKDLKVFNVAISGEILSFFRDIYSWFDFSGDTGERFYIRIPPPPDAKTPIERHAIRYIACQESR